MGLKGSMVLPDSGLPVAEAYICLTKNVINITSYNKDDNVYLIATGARENNMPSNTPIGKYMGETYACIFANQEAREANKDPIYRHIVQVAFNDMTEYVVELYKQLKIDFPNMVNC
jgi:hypothetical protein